MKTFARFWVARGRRTNTWKVFPTAGMSRTDGVHMGLGAWSTEPQLPPVLHGLVVSLHKYTVDRHDFSCVRRCRWAVHTHHNNNNNNNNNNNRIQRRYSRFFTISSQHRKLSPTHTLKWPGRNRMQIMCNTLSAYHVQVSCYVPLCTKRQLSC